MVASATYLLGGQTLSGQDRYGRWKATIDGWWDTPDLREPGVERDRADGDYDLPATWDRREVTLKGRCFTTSHDQQHEAMNRLTGLLAMGGQVLTVRGHGPDQWATVRGSVSVSPVTSKLFTFTIKLTAADPRKFGDLQQWTLRQNQSVAVYHYGNYWATPKFTVTGSFPGGYVIRLAARSYVVTRPLLSGETHTIDYRDGRLRVNGTVVFGGVSSSNVYLVEPGQLDTLAFEPLTSGTGQLVCSLPDTYM